MFSTLLPEVISKYVFPFLRLNDLLRLRRVCKLSKELADDYLRLHGTSERIIRLKVDEGSDDLTTFLALPFTVPVTRFDLVNEGNSSWDREEMHTFSSLYGGKITHLRIGHLYIPIESPRTVQFFEGFPNLKELRIGYLEESKCDEKQGPQFEPPGRDLHLPSTFKRIEHLYVSVYTCRPQLFFKFMEECSKNPERVYFSHPNDFSRLDTDNAFEWVRRIVGRRHRENPSKPNLKYLDLQRFHADRINANNVRRFYELVAICSAHNVKLQNVDARLIEEMMKLDTPDRGLHGHKISICVVSVNNLTSSVFHLELPHLERIDLGTLYCSMPEGDFQKQPWSNLKELKLWVDSEYLGVHDFGDVPIPGRFYNSYNYCKLVSVSRLFEFLFNGIRRENLESLELSYSFPTNPYSNLASVCSSCPNLKKLNLENWSGTSRDIAQLWGSLPLLEDMAFNSCKNLGDAAFIGDDVTKPVILKATRLKSLRFKYLDEMPGITDALFTSALRHMPLMNLYLESAMGRVSSFTLAGLESLLTGKFAETIEKFPLKGKVKLEGVTPEQLAELEGRFRSAQM